jgi:hypothetical protein
LKNAGVLAIEDHHKTVTGRIILELLFGWLVWNFAEQAWHDIALDDLQQALVDRSFHHEKRLT